LREFPPGFMTRIFITHYLEAADKAGLYFVLAWSTCWCGGASVRIANPTLRKEREGPKTVFAENSLYERDIFCRAPPRLRNPRLAASICW
jgi:hypothetical protein